MTDAARSRLAAALLAGGESRRMGRPKASAETPDGRTLSSIALDALAALAVPLVVVGHGAGVEPRAGLALVADVRAGQGPLGGLEALLSSGIARSYVVLPVDMPRVTPALLSALDHAREQSAALAAVAHVAGRPSFAPFPLAISSDALSVVRDFLDRGDLRVMRAVAAIGPVELQLPAERAVELENINTPEELAAFDA